MAEIVSSLVNGSQVKVVYSYTQNIAANTSTISATLWVHRDSYGPSYDTGCSAYININGSRAMTYTSSFNIGSSWVQIGGTGSMTVAHNSDGTKVCNITGYFSSSITSKLTGLSASQSVTLTTIPRASTLTSTPSITIGDNFDAGINRADSSFTHSASLFVSMSETSGYSHIKTIDGIGTSFNSNFSDAEIQTMFSVVPAGNTGYLQIQLTTYSGSTEIGSYTWVRGRAYTAAPTSPAFDNVNIGSVMGISTNRARSDYTHTVTVAFGSWSTTIGTGVTASVNWNTANNAANLYAQIPNANSGVGAITVTTYSHGANIGSRSANFTAYVINSNPTFTGFTYKDTNTSSVTISGESSKVIQDVSSVQVTINGAAAKNSATISSYKVQYGSKSLSSSSNAISFGALPNNDSFIITVIDSRGNSAQQSLTVSVIPYARPTITALTLSRVNDIEANSILTCSGAYAHCMVTTSHYALKYRYKATSSSTWSDYVGITPTLAQDNYTFSASIGNFDIGTSYNFEVVPYDYFYSNTVTGFLPTSKPLLSMRTAQIGINKIPQQGALDVSGKIYSDSEIHATGLATAKNLNYAEKIQSGAALTDCNTFTAGQTFAYGCNAPYVGSLLSFGGLYQGYDCQLQAGYNTDAIAHRVRNGDASTWRSWYRFYDESFHPYSDQSAALARHGDNAPMYFNWSGQGGQPSWLWGGSDGTNMYVYNPSNFSVWAARTLGAPRWAYTCNIASGASATFTHNLNNGTPIVMFSGTQGNVNINWNTSGANQIIVSQYNTGSNNWYGTIQIW